MKYNYFSPVFLLLLLWLSVNSYAAIETHNFANDTERARYQSLIEEMRCPKCQNQNLAGSDSPISMDLRREIYTLIKDGKSDGEITEFMVARYGEFILYKPRVSALTYLLWGGPIFLFVLAIIVLIVFVRSRRRSQAEQISQTLTEQEQAQLNTILQMDAGNASSVDHSTKGRAS